MSASIYEFVSISLDGVRSVCPSEIAAIEQHPSFPDWCQIIDYLDDDEGDTLTYEYDEDIRGSNDWPRLNEEFSALWSALHKAFKEATQGLVLYYEYIDYSRCDHNDAYPDSDVDGFLFYVDGTHETKLTASGEVVKDHLECVHYIQYDE